MITSALLINITLILVGLAALLAGGEILVRGSSRFARGLGINPAIIGLTIVAFGTSSPEFVVCLVAALKGSSDIALGNIIGSNIANIALILGIASIIRPTRIDPSILKTQVPFMIFITVVAFFLCLGGWLGRVDGLVLFLFLIAIIVYSYYRYKIETNNNNSSRENNGRNARTQLVLIVAGLAALLIGARLTVDQAIIFARTFNLSELLIGITVIAVGTSLPELSTAIMSAIKKEHELVVGNVIGSNIFNLGILGLVALIHPVAVNPTAIRFDLPVMVALSVLIYPVMRIGSNISRLEGVLLLLFYAAFIYMII